MNIGCLDAVAHDDLVVDQGREGWAKGSEAVHDGRVGDVAIGSGEHRGGLAVADEVVGPVRSREGGQDAWSSPCHERVRSHSGGRHCDVKRS